MPLRKSQRSSKPATRPRIPGVISRKILPGHRRGVMNKTEAEYAGYLQAKLEAKEIIYYGFEEVTLRLSKTVRYTPDYIVIYADGAVRFHEVKGRTGRVGAEKPYFHDRAGKIAVNIAAAKFPFIFYVVFKAGGGKGWVEIEVDV